MVADRQVLGWGRPIWALADQGWGQPSDPQTVVVFYRVYANELATQTSHLDADHGYFNGSYDIYVCSRAKERPQSGLKLSQQAGR
jgi:predicted metalloprotease with PDZ domain